MPKSKQVFEIDPDRSIILGEVGNIPNNFPPDLIQVDEENPTTENGKKPQIPQRIHHFFTWNNFDPDNDSSNSSVIPTLTNFFNEFCYSYVFQHEVGEKCGTHHLQGVISLKKKMRDTEFGLPKQICWAKPRNVAACYDYCSKSNTRVNGPWFKGVKIKRPLKLLEPKQFYPWQQSIMDIIQTEPDDRTIHWYWEPEGCRGKSAICKYLVANHKAVFIDEGSKKDIMNTILNADMDESRIVVLDVPRGNQNNVSYKSLEAIKNGMIYSGKYEGGYKLFNAPHIIVFANTAPKLEEMSNDRWHIVRLNEEI